jgi:hypothetical protein
MFSAVLKEQCPGEAIDHNDDRPLASLSPYPKFTLQKRLQTGVRESVSRQPQSIEASSVSRQQSSRSEEKKNVGLFPPVVCGRRTLSLAHGPVGFPVSFHDLAGITQQVFLCFFFEYCGHVIIIIWIHIQLRRTVEISMISSTCQRTSSLRVNSGNKLNRMKTYPAAKVMQQLIRKRLLRHRLN